MALFSKKHYIALAKTLCESQKKTRYSKDTMDCIARDIADMLNEDNPKFNYNKFLDAAEGIKP